MTIKDFLNVTTLASIHKKSFQTALVVGAVLTLVNQYNTLMEFEISLKLLLHSSLNFIVPFVVSLYAQVISRLHIVPGAISPINASIQCANCKGILMDIREGEHVPFCLKCKDTKWVVKAINNNEVLIDKDRSYSMALFTEYSPMPVLRISPTGMILNYNNAAVQLLNLKSYSTHDIFFYLPDITREMLADCINSGKTMFRQIELNKKNFQVQIIGIAHIGSAQVYVQEIINSFNIDCENTVLKAAVEQNSDAIMITNSKGEITYVNNAFSERTGYKVNEVLGQNPRFLKSDYLPDKVYKDLWETITHGKTWQGLFHNKKKDGSLYWEEAIITPVKDVHEDISHFVAIKQDVTELLATREKINSMALFSNLNPAPVFRCNTSSVIVEANPAANSIFENEKLNGHNIKSLLPELEFEDFQSIIDNDENRQIECVVGDKVFLISLKGVSVLDIAHLYATDITLQKIAEEKLDSMALFSRLNPEPVFRFDASLQIIEANPAAKEAFPDLTTSSIISDTIPFVNELDIISIIEKNERKIFSDTINGNHYRFMIRGISDLEICQVYSSDITQRVQAEEQVRFQSENIQSSIRYARNIQNAILPTHKKLEGILSESMVLFNPRDIVSGDFFWITEHQNKAIVVVADCTGHGVPGAFMSLLGISFLNQIVTSIDPIESDIILDQLREMIIASLAPDDHNQVLADGMDLALCVIDKNLHTIEFSGANNPLWYFTNDRFFELKADRMPIGRHINDAIPFSKHTINYHPDDVFYLFSDGYPDQIGGPREKKYGRKNFREFITQIHADKLCVQKKLLEDNFNSWKKDFFQIDDVLVFGFRP